MWWRLPCISIQLLQLIFTTAKKAGLSDVRTSSSLNQHGMIRQMAWCRRDGIVCSR
jgi:hypothetical protein